MLDMVRLPSKVRDSYPGELSGGERQRAAIARALVARPKAVICDEVTSALDASVQASVLTLLHELRDELDLALLFITHDLGVVASLADSIIVLDQGEIVEAGTVGGVISTPAHDYTRRLLKAAPRPPSPRSLVQASPISVACSTRCRTA